VLVGSGIVLVIWMMMYTYIAEKPDSIISNGALTALYLSYLLKLLSSTVTQIAEAERLRSSEAASDLVLAGVSMRQMLKQVMQY